MPLTAAKQVYLVKRYSTVFADVNEIERGFFNALSLLINSFMKYNEREIICLIILAES